MQMTGRTRGTWRRSVLAIGFALAWAATAQAQTSSPGAEMDYRSLIRRSFEAWAAGTGSPFQLLADDATWTITGNSAGAGTYTSREQFMEAVIRPFNARLSEPLKPAVRQLYQDGSSVVAHFDAAATARDGRPYRNTYAWIIDLRGDRIVRVVAFFDAIAFDDLWERVAPAGP